MKYIIFESITRLENTDRRQPYPYNTYATKKEQVWKVISTKLNRKDDMIMFTVTCPKRTKRAVECGKWVGKAEDVRKIIL